MGILRGFTYKACLFYILYTLFFMESALSFPFSSVANKTPSPATKLLGRFTKRDFPAKRGYVAFGDSYAAGMGTGTTSSDSCRIGSNNFANLLYKWFNDESVDFQPLMCSGDTTIGLNRQIDKWSNPNNDHMATVSIGGNDIGFGDLAFHCVLTPNTLRLGSQSRKRCLEAEAKARQLLDDQSGSGLQAKLTAAYKKILDKSGRSVGNNTWPHCALSESR